MDRFRAVTATGAGVLVLFAVAGCGGDGGDANGEADGGGGDDVEVVSVVLEEVGGSGQTATATLTASGPQQTHVFILIDDEGVAPSQPAHIHEGTCANLNPEPAYGLETVITSISETIVDVPLETLTAGEYAINLHMAPDDLETYTSCGDIAG